jgi:ABC-type antimicrobial peptide transport system ATPase subunit
MFERKVESQIVNLILDHEKLGITLIYFRAGSVPHIVEKLSMRATILF